jgi:hypothetical protein
MSRRWYRHNTKMVFVGWDRALGQFLVTVAELCDRCGGYGEEPTTDNFCFACGGEGVKHDSNSLSALGATANLDDVAAELAKLNIAFPNFVRADLEADKRANVGELVHYYVEDPTQRVGDG